MNTVRTPVSAVMRPPPVCVRVETPATEIAELLAREAIGAVAVVEHGGVVLGVVTDKDGPPRLDHDRARWWHRGRSRQAAEWTARDVMTCPAIAVEVDESVAVAAARMARTGLGRLFVVAGGRPVGVVARRDLIEALPGVAAVRDGPDDGCDGLTRSG